MTASLMISELKSLGVELWADAGQLRFRAPKGVLTEERISLLRAHKQELLELLTSEQIDHLLIPEAERRYEPFPLTDVQSAYLLGRAGAFDHSGVACHAYLEATYPKLEPQLLTNSWNKLILRHDMLRAVIEQDGYQRVLHEVPRYQIVVSDLRSASDADLERELTRTREELDHRIYPTASWPLFELRQTRTRTGDIVHFSLDSLIADWASAGVLFEELEACIAGRFEDIRPLGVTFRDLVLAERRLRETSRYQGDREYWLARIDELPEAPALPLERKAIAPPTRATFRRHRWQLSADLWDQLKKRASERNITPSMAVLTAYAAVVHRFSSRRPFSLNLTLLNRLPLHPEVDGVVGDFTSVNVLAVDLDNRAESGSKPENSSIRSAAQQLGSQLFADLDHRLYSGIEVMREITRRRGRDAASMPVVFTSGIGLGPRKLPESGRRFGYGVTQTPQVLLDCQVMEDEGGLAVNWDIRQGTFPDRLIEDMFASFTALLTDLAERIEVWDRPRTLPLPGWQTEERTRANATGAPLPQETLHAGIIAQAARTPDALAIASGAEQLTYREVVLRASGVAEALRTTGLEPGDRAGIYMNKGPDQVVAVLGVLLARGVYVPLDTTQPALRREKILRDAGVRHVLTHSSLALSRDLSEDLTLVEIDRLAPAGKPAAFIPCDPNALAYVIYTSGSSGHPKGVMISHRAALNTIIDIQRRFGIDGSDRVLGLAELGFDLSVYDIFGTLRCGGTLVLPDPEYRADPSHWARTIAEHGVHIWNSVPAQMQMLANYLESTRATVPSLRLALLSGDWIPITLPGLLDRLCPEMALVSLGGATEASIWSNYHRIERVDPTWASIPYGFPLANQGFRILDDTFEDAPVWVAGDLYITGAGLAAGYLADPSLSAARFLEHPVDGLRMYKTGDRARYLPGGEVEFLGREDNQIKLRGHRIELGEIESALLAHPGVSAAAAVVSAPEHGEPALLGFVQPATQAATQASHGVRNRDDHTPKIAHEYAQARLKGSEAQAQRHVQLLHDAAFSSMLLALVQSGLFGESSQTHSADDVLARAHVHDRHRWLVRRWLALLVSSGHLTFDPPSKTYRRTRETSAHAVEAAWQRVEQHGAANGICTEAFVNYHRAHVARIDALLCGEQSPFELLFPQGRTNVALSLYRDHASVLYDNHVVAAMLNRIAAANLASEEPLQVLEVGAGTGATTEAANHVLEGYDVDYLFTDQSPFFLSEARNRFSGFPGFRVGAFDFDEAYRKQGLQPNSVDVVVAAGVLNAVSNVDRALDTTRDVLRPGGWLLFTEPTIEHPHILLTQGFMMNPREADREFGRSPLRSNAEWCTLIEKHGGNLVACLPEDDHPMAHHGMHTFAARFKTDLTPIRTKTILHSLREALPPHMLPASLQILDHLPLTTNGKVDRKALTELRVRTTAAAVASRSNEEALDELEQRIAAVWLEALSVANLGRDENFYDRGADSLILARVAGRLREQVSELKDFPYDDLLRQMLNEPTIGALGRMVRNKGDTPKTLEQALSANSEPAIDSARADEATNSLIVPFGGRTGPARVMFHAALGTMDYFQHLGKELCTQKLGPVIGLALADPECYLAIPAAELVARVADAYTQRLISEGYKQFQLIGYCLGGLLAVEVARRLFDRGLEICDLTLVDSIPMFMESDEELAFEAIFVPNLNLDPVSVVFGDEVTDEDLYRAVSLLLAKHQRRLPADALSRLEGDPGLEAVARAARRQGRRRQEERLAEYARAAANQAGIPVEPELVPALFRICRHSMRAARFDPEPFIGDMTFLRCMQQQSFGITGGVGHLAAPFWEKVCVGDFNLVDVPGNHFSVIEPPHVGIVAHHLAVALQRKP